MNKIYVGNLPYETTEADLRATFNVCGAIDTADVIFDRYTGKSKGFAFITFTDENSVNDAINKFNGKEISGRRMKVSEAKEKSSEGRGGDDRGGRGDDRGDRGGRGGRDDDRGGRR